ncbi:unnamed protein product [Coccothraustes coccothraustes]
MERSLCEKDAFTERGVICFHKAISHWKPIDCDVQESEFPDLTVPFGLKMYPPMIDGRDIPQGRRGGLVSHGDTEDNSNPRNQQLLPYPTLSHVLGVEQRNLASAITARTPASFPLPPSGRQGSASIAGCPKVVAYGSSWWEERGAVRKLEFTGGVCGRNVGSEQRNGGS